MKKRTLFTGAATALVTPFRHGKIDYPALAKIIEAQINAGIRALIVCGTTGEPCSLSSKERTSLLEFALDCADKRAVMIAGTGTSDTVRTCRLTREAAKLGYDAALVVTPYYNKTSQRGLIDHYTYIADRVDIPMIIYNVPGRTGMNISVDTVVELAKHKNIKAMKDATDNIAYAMDVLTHTKDLDFDMYSGCDDNILPFMAAGGKGVISVLSNIYPRETEKFTQAILKGDMELARQMAYDLNDVSKYLFIDVNPIMPKAALAHLGVCGEAVRRPLIKTTQENKDLLFKAMKEFEEKGY